MEYRVYGPPGTGKTSWLAAQIRAAVLARGSDDVIVASFTRGAAQELAGRDLPIDRSRIGTLHAHCYRALGSPQIAETKLPLWNEDNPGLPMGDRDGSLDEPAWEQNGGHSAADLMCSEAQNYRARQYPLRLWPDITAEFYRKWCAWKQDMGFIDFTDMLELALEQIDEAPGAPSVGFFDEVQDFTPLELALVRKWGAHMDRFVLAGDDDQCIYGFKGATPAAFLAPDLPADQKRVLGQSYRLPRAVYDYVETWIKRVKVREPKDYRPTDRQGEVVRTASTFLEDEAIIREAIDYAEAGKTVMFLATCSYQVRTIVKSLRIHAYPFHNPYRRKRGDWNPLRRNKSMPADRLLAFLRIDEGTWDTEAREWTGADLKKWVPLIDAKCGLLVHGAKKAVKEMGDGPVKDYGQYFEPERFEKLFYSEDRLDILKDWMLKGKRAMMGYSVDMAKHHGGKMVRQTPRITVGTIHSVKGGEADVVYVFPDLSKAGFQEYDSRRRDSVLRLFYVAFTRAKERLVLCSPSGYFKAEF